ncbi:hypothetical protein HDV63DRAFT_12559 [Trichoderma sp. SZMC 28014]
MDPTPASELRNGGQCLSFVSLLILMREAVPPLMTRLRPVPLYPSLVSYCLKRQVARPGFRDPKLTSTLSLQRPFALVRARATGLLGLGCAIDPVRSNERRAVAANGDLCIPCWAFSTFYLLPTGGASQILDITRGSDKAWGFLACQEKACIEKNSRKA